MNTYNFELFSEGIKNGYLHQQYGSKNTVDVKNGVPAVSFPLQWINVPKGTVSLSLIFEDFDNVEDEGVPWIHWLVADIPVSVGRLSENESRTNLNLIQGCNSWALPYGPYVGISLDTIRHYGGPAPGRIHEYECTLYALDCFLDLKTGFYLNQLRRGMEGHILGQKTLKMSYDPD